MEPPVDVGMGEYELYLTQKHFYRERLFVPNFIAHPMFYLWRTGWFPIGPIFFTKRMTRFTRSLVGAIWVSDRMPWFARKPLINWLLGQEVYSDFLQADHSLTDSYPMFEIRIKF